MQKHRFLPKNCLVPYITSSFERMWEFKGTQKKKHYGTMVPWYQQYGHFGIFWSILPFKLGQKPILSVEKSQYSGMQSKALTSATRQIVKPSGIELSLGHEKKCWRTVLYLSRGFAETNGQIRGIVVKRCKRFLYSLKYIYIFFLCCNN